MNKQRILMPILLAFTVIAILAIPLYAAKPSGSGGGGGHGGGGSTTTTTTIPAVQSDYVVNYVSGVNYNPSTTGYPNNITTLVLQPGFSGYYWTASAAVAIDTHNYTVDAQAMPQYNPPVNGSDAGHSSSSVGTITETQPNAHSDDWEGLLAGVGVDLPFQNAVLTAYSDNGPLKSKSVTHTYTVTTPGSFTIIDVAQGSANMAHFTSISVPSGCTILVKDLYLNASVGLDQAVCPNQAAGTYDISWSVSGKQSGVTTAAYTFAPYSVSLAVNQTGAGTIATNGNSYSSGTISVMGTGSITANAAPGYTFSHWSVSNSSNLVIGNTTAANTTLTVLGSGTVTADFV